MTPLAPGDGAHTGDLSNRDWELLHDVERVRILTAVQAQRLHFATGSNLTQARRCRAALQRLTTRGLLHRYERTVGGVYAGSTSYVYSLGTKGQRLISGHGPAGGVRVRRPWESSRLFFNHMLAISELYVVLKEAERIRGCDILEFAAEPTCWRTWTDTNGKLIVKPDAFVRAGAGDVELSAFVEVDLATESRSVIRRKAETYVDYWLSGIEQDQTGLFPRVVWIVPTHRRREQIVDALTAVDPTAWRLFQVVLAAEAADVLTKPPPGDLNGITNP